MRVITRYNAVVCDFIATKGEYNAIQSKKPYDARVLAED